MAPGVELWFAPHSPPIERGLDSARPILVQMTRAEHHAQLMQFSQSASILPNTTRRSPLQRYTAMHAQHEARRSPIPPVSQPQPVAVPSTSAVTNPAPLTPRQKYAELHAQQEIRRALLRPISPPKPVAAPPPASVQMLRPMYLQFNSRVRGNRLFILTAQSR